MRVTNVVLKADLHCRFSLKVLAQSLGNCVFNPRRYSGLIWQHRKLKSKCFVFHTGRILCVGNNTLDAAKKDLRKYVRILSRFETVNLTKIHVVTLSGVHYLSGKFDMETAARELQGTYEPEIFNAAMFKIEKIHFTCFRSGSVIITGVKNIEDVYPFLIMLELYTL
jgi:TATA-box binding protein (TBP) (component of TFIID and TFIIIB)